MITISGLIILIIIACVVWFWQSSNRSREFAIKIAEKTCIEQNLQFLDGTVTYKKLTFARNNDGRLGIKRFYTFDYYDGEERLNGNISIFNNSVAHLELRLVSASNDKKIPPSNDNVIPFPIGRRKKK